MKLEFYLELKTSAKPLAVAKLLLEAETSKEKSLLDLLSLIKKHPDSTKADEGYFQIPVDGLEFDPFPFSDRFFVTRGPGSSISDVRWIVKINNFDKKLDVKLINAILRPVDIAIFCKEVEHAFLTGDNEQTAICVMQKGLRYKYLDFTPKKAQEIKDYFTECIVKKA